LTGLPENHSLLELTDAEKKLLETQQMMEIRGKVCSIEVFFFFLGFHTL